MEKLEINKSIDINAPKQWVWDAITNSTKFHKWLAAFGENNTAETDWKQGSKAIFKDDKSGLIGNIKVSDPYNEIIVEYIGIISDNKEDYESPEAAGVKGYQEKYFLSENNGITTLSISCDMESEYFDFMSDAWTQALQILKDLAENSERNSLLEQLNKTTKDFSEAFRSFEQDEINEVPFEGSWTAAQVVEHILLSETDIPQMLLGPTAPTQRPYDQFVPELEGIFLDFSTKLKAPDFNIPGDGPFEQQDLLDKFLKERGEAAEIVKHEDLTLTSTSFPFPQMAELTRWEWIKFMIVHSTRHTRQLRHIWEKLREQVKR